MYICVIISAGYVFANKMISYNTAFCILDIRIWLCSSSAMAVKYIFLIFVSHYKDFLKFLKFLKFQLNEFRRNYDHVIILCWIGISRVWYSFIELHSAVILIQKHGQTINTHLQSLLLLFRLHDVGQTN